MKTISKFALPIFGVAGAAAGVVLFLGAMTPGSAQAADAKTDRQWRANCASCHGKDGKGDTEQGKKMKTGDMTSADWQKKYKDEDMKKSISEGFKRDEDGVTKEMKPFKSKLKPEEIDALVAFVREFAKAK